MQPSKSIIFSAQELRTLKKIYTFRKVAETINKNTATTITNNESIYVFYGSRDALSPNQYNLFREYIIKNTNNKTKLTIELIPATIFKSFIRFSPFQIMQNILKGSIYQRKVTISTNDNVTKNFVNETECYKKLFMLFNQFKRVQFTEKTNFDYTPSLFISITNNGSLVPIRFGQLQSLSKSLQTPNEASFALRSNLIFLQDKLNSKTNYLAE